MILCMFLSMMDGYTLSLYIVPFFLTYYTNSIYITKLYTYNSPPGMYQLLEASLVCIFDISLSSKKSIQQYDEQMVFDQLSWDGSYNPNTQCMLCLPSFG